MSNDVVLFEEQINSESVTNQLRNYIIDDALVRRVKQTSITEVRKNPKLLECEPNSLIGSIFQAVQMGLSLDSNLGHAALVPFNENIGTYNSPKWIKKCQLMPMYRGFIHLGFKTGQILSVDSYVTKSKDTYFSYKIVDGVVLLSHEPALSDRGDLTGAYVVINFKSGAKKIVFMDDEEIMKCKASSKTKNTDKKGNPIETIWDKFPEEMYKKTVIRRAFKQVDLSPQLSAAVSMDELCEAGVDQKNDAFIEVSDFKKISHEVENKDNALINNAPKAGEEDVRPAHATSDDEERLDNIHAIRALLETLQYPEGKVKVWLSKYKVNTVDELNHTQSAAAFKKLHEVYQARLEKQP